ncbi:hypothetical protein Pint_07228 [Pistacia integerrima]|uniref:Uncharacterized protein n=1 Tax=Pistacia integerrima TaxID=434235 RepID=A0ACC0XX14_9ROSI|nr:hypothetical protein Pint_07228 [Pistacia integerrima]
MKLIGVTCISTTQQIAMDGIFDDKDGMLFSPYMSVDHKIYIRCTTNALHCQNTIIFTTLKNAVEKYESGNLRLEATNGLNA